MLMWLGPKGVFQTYYSTFLLLLDNSDKEISAYIGLYELNNISKKYLDSLYSKLDIEIKNSFYGKKLKKKLDSFI